MDKPVDLSVLAMIAEGIDIPDSAYELATARYKNLGSWLDRSESSLQKNAPHVSAQGSFRLGTVIRPESEEDEYDLDLSCELRAGITERTHSQRQLKEMVRSELESYRRARGVESELEEKHRCWRLQYKDKLKFHLDIVPCIPQEESIKSILEARMIKTGSDSALASQVKDLAVAITDNRLSNYTMVSPGWLISNPEGYARWFMTRMRLSSRLLVERASQEKVASIDALPIYRWKTPLQRCIQILKRHRNIMFQKDKDRQPISMIITTLAAYSYSGESDIEELLPVLLDRMPREIQVTTPKIPNPVNGEEDFAERWDSPEGRKLSLEQCFYDWIEQAKRDLKTLSDNAGDPSYLEEQAMLKYGTRLTPTDMEVLTSRKKPQSFYSPKDHTINGTARPWHSR
jgi:hypothetical protein